MAAFTPIVAASVAASARAGRSAPLAADGYPEITYLRRDCTSEHDALLGRPISPPTARRPSAVSLPPEAPAAGASLWQRALRPLVRLLCWGDDVGA